MTEASSTQQPLISASRRPPILIADRDRELVALIAYTLQRAGLAPIAAHDESSALDLFVSRRPAVVVLDSSGLDLLRQFRAASRDTAIIVLTAVDSMEHRVLALELGADDYLSKPFSHRELLARVRARLRRSHPDRREGESPVSRLFVGDVLLDLDQHFASIAGRPIHLSRMEFRVLHYMMLRVGTVVPVAQLMNEFWHSDDVKASNAMRVTFHRLRHKLQPDWAKARVLETVPGVGFRLSGDAAALCAI